MFLVRVPVLGPVRYSTLLQIAPMFVERICNRLLRAVVWFSVWVREVPGSIPGAALSTSTAFIALACWVGLPVWLVAVVFAHSVVV